MKWNIYFLKKKPEKQQTELNKMYNNFFRSEQFF